MKKFLLGLTKTFGGTLVLLPLWSWTSQRFCYWHGLGWCADVQPIFDWMLAGLVTFGAVGIISILLRARWPDAPSMRSGSFIAAFLLAVAGGYFTMAESRRTEMVQASGSGDAELVSRALENGSSPNAMVHRGGPSALYQTVHAKSLPAASKLLEAGADPDGGNSNCALYHPLSAAYMTGNAPMISLLIKYKASVPCHETQRLLIEKYNIPPETFTEEKN